MKSKTSPTSPKAQQKYQKDEEINSLYKEELATIEKPRQQLAGGRIVTVIVAALFGVIGGILGLLLLFAYGADIPFLNELGIITLNHDGNGITVTPVRQQQEAQEIPRQVIATAPSMALIFSERNITTAAESHIAAEALGTAFVLTQDGYLVTSAALDTSGTYHVLVHDGGLYQTIALRSDPATGMIFMKIDAANLSTVQIASAEDTSAPAAVYAVNKSGQQQQVIVTPATAVDTDYHPVTDTASLQRSSEQFSERLLLDSANLIMPGSLVVTAEGEIIGISAGEMNSTVLPLYHIRPILQNILTDSDLLRPQFGVRYVLLDDVIGLGEQTYGILNGALISAVTADQEAIIPGSPAAGSDLQAGDIITAIDDTAITNDVSLDIILKQYTPGSQVTVTYVRDGATEQTLLTLTSQ